MNTVEEEIAELDRRLIVGQARRDAYTPEVIEFLTRLEDPSDDLAVDHYNRDQAIDLLIAWRQFKARPLRKASATEL